jgi:hypothetical protein
VEARPRLLPHHPRRPLRSRTFVRYHATLRAPDRSALARRPAAIGVRPAPTLRRWRPGRPGPESWPSAASMQNQRAVIQRYITSVEQLPPLAQHI